MNDNGNIAAVNAINTSRPHSIIEARIPVFLLLLLLLLKSEPGKGQSYDRYHQMISAAEEFYFLENNVDSALFCYERCFESFDFVFARDAVNALQIAYREGRPVEAFLKTSFESGVKPSNLSGIPALSDFAQDSLPESDVMRNYDLHRAHYLDRINVDCLNSIYMLGMIDQITKYKKGKDETEALFKLASMHGLPGERNCGIEDLEINRELGGGALDFLTLRDSISEKYGRSLGHFSLNNASLIMHLPLVIMLHNACTFKHRERALRKAYLGGFIHPREIGSIYDNSYGGAESQCRIIPNMGVFGLNMFVNTGKTNTEKANRLRAKWGICSVDADVKKRELEKSGFKFIWDYW